VVRGRIYQVKCVNTTYSASLSSVQQLRV
jgi:hypothetical protein